ncbi:MAG: folate family ECF transporter S component [Butyricicoccus sp.]|nr:folate family ECF transporter S component [Butyricicoccus sp.]
MSKWIDWFRTSARRLRDPRCLALTALFIALNVTLDLTGLTLRLSPELRIGFGYLCNAAIGMLFGPCVGMVAGVCTDVLGYFAGNFTMGGYFPGYTLTAIVGGLIYGLWLYRPDGSLYRDSRAKRIARIVGAKASINLFCNIVLNTLWLTLTSGKAMAILLPLRVMKNVVLLVPECILLYFALQFILLYHRSIAPSTR